MANYSLINDNKLITKEQWFNLIDSIKSESTKPLITNVKIAKELIKDSLIDSIKKRSKEDFGILFSGGLDSSLIALISKNLNNNFTCYSLGIKDSSDIKYASEVASLLKLNIKTKLVSLEEIEETLKKCISLLDSRDVVKLEIAIVMYLALNLAKQETNNVFVGAGSEEIFAGYERHQKYLESGLDYLQEQCWLGLKSCYERDITRDYEIARKLKISLLTPFLDELVIKTTMSISPELKVSQKEKKIILRELALDLGLPKEIAYRKRTAAQYGSGVSSAILKLTKKNGFKYKQDYINSIHN